MEKIREGVIYKITNLLNGKTYIGQTMHLQKEGAHSRYSNHLYSDRLSEYTKTGKKRRFQLIDKMIRKYGHENFTYEEIFYTKGLYENVMIILNILEQYYIRKYNSLASQNGYNLDKGGKHPYNMNKDNMGRIPWNKGKTNVYSKETLKILSDKKIGHSPWNKGLKNCYSKEVTLKYCEYLKIGREIGIKM